MLIYCKNATKNWKTVKCKQLKIVFTKLLCTVKDVRVLEKQFLEKHGFGGSHGLLLLKPESLPKVALKFGKLEFAWVKWKITPIFLRDFTK